jgi:hypothetical protein
MPKRHHRFRPDFRRRSRSRSVPALGVPALVTLCLAFMATVGLQAQEPPPTELPLPEDTLVDERDRSLHALDRPASMNPASGPPGTRVDLEVSLLPALTPMQVAIGGTRFGFEELILTMTDQHGDLAVTVEIPEWAAAERAHRFIIFNAYFTSVHAATSLFHVTDSEGKIRRQGEVTWSGPECATLTSADDEVYDLVGELEGLEMGARVVVEGWILNSEEIIHRVEGICPGEGMALQVAGVERPDPDA